jgi:hypothetical protein
MIFPYSRDQQKLSEFKGITSSTFYTSILDIDAVIPPEAISCDKGGACVVDGIPGGLAALKDILDREGFHPCGPRPLNKPVLSSSAGRGDREVLCGSLHCRPDRRNAAVTVRTGCLRRPHLLHHAAADRLYRHRADVGGSQVPHPSVASRFHGA